MVSVIWVILQLFYNNVPAMEAKEKKYLSVREAAEYIGYSVGYIYKLVANNALPCYIPNGGRIIFNRVELDEWIKTNGKRQGKPGDRCIVIR